MMARVGKPRLAMVTSVRHPRLSDDDAPLLKALARPGLEVDVVCWDDEDVDWKAYDLAHVRSPWDYHWRQDEFAAWLDRVEQECCLINSAEVIRWNIDKAYLALLFQVGMPIIPTVPASSLKEARNIAERAGWLEYVVKPRVGLGGRHVIRLSADSEPPEEVAALETNWCVQPFLPSVLDHGELSVIVVDGRATHALRKIPANGDFRVHEGYGGSHRPYPVTAELSDISAKVLGTEPLRGASIARVDLIRDEQDQLLVVEVDATSPCLYFCHSPGSASLVAAAIADSITG